MIKKKPKFNIPEQKFPHPCVLCATSNKKFILHSKEELGRHSRIYHKQEVFDYFATAFVYYRPMKELQKLWNDMNERWDKRDAKVDGGPAD